jgi:uncharacterized protein YegP (UPF0339 family)
VTSESRFSDKGDDRFEIFRANEVNLTSTLFSGGDWRWRLANRAGETLVEGCGYRTEADCEGAVVFLQTRAQFARICDATGLAK